jgi:hypothetical protein
MLTSRPDGIKFKVIKHLDSIKERRKDEDNNGSDPSSGLENSGSKSYEEEIKEDVGHFLNDFDFTE